MNFQSPSTSTTSLPARPSRGLVLFLALLTLAQTIRWFLPDYLRADIFSDDAAQHIWWTQRFADPGLFPHDFIADFFSRPVFAPPGWQAIFHLLVPLWGDAQAVSEVIPFLLAAPVALLAFCLGWHISGRSVLGGTIATLGLLMTRLFNTFEAGFPRSFALVLLMLGTWAVLSRRLAWLGGAFVLSAIFYPPMIINLGLFSAAVLGWRWWRERKLPDGWRSLMALGFAAALIVVWNNTRGIPPDLGPKVTLAEARAMPEFGPRGRSQFFSNDAVAYWIEGSRSGLGIKPAWHGLVAGGIVAVSTWMWPRIVAFEVWALAVTALMSFGVAHATLFTLHLPNRYVSTAFDLVSLLWVTAMLSHALSALRQTPLGRRFVAILVRPAVLRPLAVAVLAVFAVRAMNRVTSTLHRPTRADWEQTLAFLRTLPKDTLVAAHPKDADLVPLRSYRSVLISKETSLPYYRGYYQRASERVDAALAACFASDWAQVDALHERYGADVFLVDRGRYLDPLKSVYFAPFSTATRTQIQRGLKEGFVLSDPPPDRVLFTRGDLAVVRLGPPRSE